MITPLPEAIHQLPPRVLIGITITSALTAVAVVLCMIAAGLIIYARSCRALDEDLAELKKSANGEAL